MTAGTNTLQQGISLCMIVRDEAQHLQLCLDSMNGLVDQMVIVDTGSQDTTTEVARSSGAEVYHFAWEDDFARARNISLAHATRDWILVLDADECLDPADHPRIKALVAQNKADAYRLEQRTYQHNSSLAEWQPVDKPTPFTRGYPGFISSPLVRLFRNRDSVRFKGRVHELVEHDLLAQGRPIADTLIPIHHYGRIADPARFERKKRQYRRIGEVKLGEDLGDGRSCMELGIQYLELDLVDEAVGVLQRAVALAGADAKAHFNLGVALGRQGDLTAARDAYDRVLALDRSHIGAYNNLAQILQRIGDTAAAKSLYEKALQHQPRHHVLHYNLGLLLEKMGQPAKAQIHFHRALEIDGSFEPARKRHQAPKTDHPELTNRTKDSQIMDDSHRDPNLASPPTSTAPSVAADPEFGSDNESGQISDSTTDSTSDPKSDFAVDISSELGTQPDHQLDLKLNQPDAPELAGDIAERAQQHLQAGRWAEALDKFVSAIEATPDDADLRFGCGLALEMLGHTDEALAQYQEVMALNSQHPETLLRLAGEADRQGLIDDCITLYGEFLTHHPDHPDQIEAHLNIAAVLVRKGDFAVATEHLEQVLALDPQNKGAAEALQHLNASRSAGKKPVMSSAAVVMKIAFIWGGSTFRGDALQHKPMGGTETAMIRMARSLADLGHHVSVYMDGGPDLDFDGVRYTELTRYLQDLKAEPVDVLVSARQFHPFLQAVPARVKVFWTEDAHDQPFVEFLGRPEVVAEIDRIFTVSQWQTRNLAQVFNIAPDKFYTTRNGVWWDHFKTSAEAPVVGPGADRDRYKLVYTSTPFRGLDALLALFPRIRARVPQARLDVYSSMSVYQMDREQDEAHYGELYQKAQQPGVSLKGSVVQKQLAAALQTAGILAYPNHFAETSCIAMLEAMAAGVPIVTSRLGALPETVAAGGILIAGEVHEAAYQDQFVDAVCRLMTDENQWEQLSRAGRQHVAENNRWDLIAEEWVTEFRNLLADKQDGVIETNTDSPALSLAGSVSRPAEIVLTETELAENATTGASTPALSPEQRMPTEELPHNRTAADPYFGPFGGLMRKALAPGGSEMGLGIGLFALAVNIGATNIIEIGRFKGFSTLALASALRFLDMGWQEPTQHKQRPDIDYDQFERPRKRTLFSIDPFPTPEAQNLIAEAGLLPYVEMIDERSDQARLSGQADLIFIDGDHTYEGCKRDVEMFIPRNLRPGGYFVLHDYFGWYETDGRNRSPIKQVADEIAATGTYQHILMDTGYQSYVVFRKPDIADQS